MTHWLITELDTVSTLRQWSVAATKWKSFNEIDGQMENITRKYLYFAMMIRYCKQMPVLQTNWWTGWEAKEKMFLLCDDDPLLQTDASPSNKLMDRSRSERENVSTLRWWSVAANRCQSFKQIDGQVEKRKRNCFYFAMMICCCWWISVLLGYLGTGRELKEKMFLLCDEYLLPLIDVRPLNKLMDRSLTEGESVLFIKYIYWLIMLYCRQCLSLQPST